MKIAISKDVKEANRSDVIMKTLFGADAVEAARVTMGTVVFPPRSKSTN